MEIVQLQPLTAAEQARVPGRFLAALIGGRLKPAVAPTVPELPLALAGFTATDWSAQRERFGQLLESFVVQQLVAQAGWTDPHLRFWHCRDKDQLEVDLVITRGRQTWGV